MKRKIKKLKKEKENTNTWKVLKTYGSIGLKGVNRALHTAQARKLHILNHKLRGSTVTSRLQ